MHRALCIPEVVAIIVEHMPVWSMHDIAALARTCRTFAEPALNALWKNPPLWYLAKTMSENIWTIEIDAETPPGSEVDLDCNHHDIRHILRFVHTPSKDSTIQLGDRFAFYAKRVQSIRLGEYDTKREHEKWIGLVVHPEVISAWFIGHKILPRIHSLVFNDDLPETLGAVSNSVLIKNTLEAPNLTTLQIWAHRSSATAFEDGMEEVLRTCSYLEELVFCVFSDDKNDWAKFLSTMLLHTTRLHNLFTNCPVSYADLLRLADYRRLSSLNFEEVSGLPEGPLILPSNLFRQLHHLNMRDYAPCARLARAVLASVQKNSLTECDLRLDSHTNLTLQDIHSVLCQVIKHANLVKISISIQAEIESNVGMLPEISAEFFSLFHSLPQLESLRFGCPFRQDMFPVNKTIISDLTQACPRLQWWYSSGYSPAQAVIPFNSLLDILRYHPDLKELPISVDASELPSAGLKAEFGQHEYGYRLIVEYVEETAELKEVVSQLFPRVMRLSIRPPHWWQHSCEIDMSRATCDSTHSDSDA